MKLLCFDGNSILNRAFYGIKTLTTKDGRYTNAVYGFTNILLKVVDEQKPDAVVVAFDLPGKTFRHKMYEGYKAKRKGMPFELAEQLPVTKELIEALGYKTVGMEGYEADDILGTFAKLCGENNWECMIATGDRDSLQLITDTTKILLTTTQYGRGETAVIDIEKVLEEYTISPSQLIDLKALMGDNSDNYPGVGGVGDKTAIPLINKFHSLDGVYENIDSKDITENLRKKLIAEKDMAYLSRELATINTAVPIEGSLNDYLNSARDNEKILKILTSLEMFSTIEKLDLTGDSYTVTPKDEENTGILPIISLEMKKEDIVDDEYYIVLAAGNIFAANSKKMYSLSREISRILLSSEKIKKYCYDVKNLCHYAMNWDIELKNISFDIMLAGYLLNPSANDYSLEHLAMEYNIKPLFTNTLYPPMGLIEPLTKQLSTLLEQKGMKDLLLNIEIPLSAVLVQMEREGFMVDTNGIKEFGRILTNELNKVKQSIDEMIGREINLNSTKQLADALFIDLGLPPGKKTKSGYSTDVEVLNGLKGKHPVIDSILSYRTFQKLNSTYVEGLLKAASDDGRVHTEFRQTETRTGRISSVNPNLQNIPVRTELGAQIRRYFIAKEGYILLDADYSQIELRVLASLSNDEKMINAFLNDGDIHTETASQVFHIPKEMINYELRRRAKAVNFGIVYGIGAFSLADDLGIPIYEARQYIEDYLETYSDVRKYLEKTVEDAKTNGYVATLFGRRRLIPELKNSNKTVQALGKRLAMNTPIQGTAADIIKIAMVKVQNRLKAEKLNANLILQVHDELIVESLIEEKEIVKRILVEEMEAAVQLKVQLVADIGEGYSWYDAK